MVGCMAFVRCGYSLIHTYTSLGVYIAVCIVYSYKLRSIAKQYKSAQFAAIQGLAVVIRRWQIIKECL